MPTLSFEGGVVASYAVAAGQTVLTIRSGSRLNYRAISVGSGQMHFHWVQEGKTQVWKCDISMAAARQAEANETSDQDGSQALQVNLGGIYPCGLLLRGRMEGSLVAPAVHIDVPWSRDVWVFIIRSPWFPLKLQVDRSLLSVKHDSSGVTASLSTSGGGGTAGEIAFSGTDFKNASLVVRRTLGAYSSDETVCEAPPGVQGFAWKPIERDFDLVLVTSGQMSEPQLAEVAKGLGAELSPGFLGPGSVEGTFVLCDGPAISYSWVLKGHRGFLENAEDSTAAKFTW